VRTAADRRRSDKPGVGAPAREQLPYVVARHQHVAVGEYDPIMARRAPALDHIVEFWIAAHPVVADQDPRIRASVLGDQSLDERHDGIVCGRDAKQDFVVRIIEIECRTQRIGGIIVQSAQRAYQADRRELLPGLVAERVPPQAENRDRDARDMDEGGDDAEGREGKNRRCHCADF